MLSILTLPSVLADIRPPSPVATAVFWAVLLIFNYIVNFILIGIQSKIWLHLGFKRIAAGLAIATPIMFILEGLVYLIFPFYPRSFLFIEALVMSIIIFLTYYLVSVYFWKIETKKSIITALIMATITNPALGYIITATVAELISYL